MKTGPAESSARNSRIALQFREELIGVAISRHKKEPKADQPAEKAREPQADDDKMIFR